ncbi:MAG: hypothetical protein ABSH36_06980 [Solirubrobacteraceae bacterium]|jgi:hypothetical protein
MLASFNGTWDWTAVGTLALAAVTGVSLLFGWKSLRQGQKEVEEAHRPVLVPLADSRRMDVIVDAGMGPQAARPDVIASDELRVPVENIGTGPALHVEASVQMLNPDGGPTGVGTGGMEPAVLAGIKASGSVAPIIKIRGLAEVPGFWLTLTYEDVSGKGWITKARYIANGNRYEDVTVNTQEKV